MLKPDNGFWTSSSHGTSMAFAKKMVEFPSDLVSFPDQTTFQKTLENPHHIFYKVLINSILILRRVDESIEKSEIRG